MNKLQFTGISDVGKKRSGNEDRYYVDWCWDEQHLLALCVDGCGGYAGGQIAAQMTVDNVCEFLNEHREGDKLNLLKQAVIYANNRVHEERNIEPDLHRMCCVLTAALIELEEERINMVHVGDTRLYAVTNGRVIKLSHDHSPIGRDEEAGLLTETEAMQHPSRNIIERAVGEKYLKADTDYIETESFPIAQGITWLFCSDGLSDMITTAEMADILGQPITLNEKAKRLVEAANEAGGKDNITIILVQAENEADEQTQTVMNHYATRITGEPLLNYNQQMTNLFREPDSEDETSEDTVYRNPNDMKGTETDIPQVVDVPPESSEEQAENEAFKVVLNSIVHINADVEIIGSWVWVHGAYAYRELLKSVGFRYAPKKKSWCWHYGEYHRHHKSEVSLDDIRAKYGSKTVNRKSKQYALN